MSNDKQVKTVAQGAESGAKGAGRRRNLSERQLPRRIQPNVDAFRYGGTHGGALPVPFRPGDVAMARGAPSLSERQLDALFDAGVRVWYLSPMHDWRKVERLVFEAERLARGVRPPISVQWLLGYEPRCHLAAASLRSGERSGSQAYARTTQGQ